ncbi:type IV pilin protein [Enterovibrio norvegicus]|uniref:type IV pilin protein n=1 Tax=Enterovibrio norvegicus TaxID=188144 RepID=UPI003D0A8362
MKKQKGFSLVELLIVVGIIGALTAIAVPAYTNQKQKAEVITAVTSLKAMRSAIDISIVDGGNNFPTDLTTLGDPGNVVISGTPATTSGTLSVSFGNSKTATYSRDTDGIWTCEQDSGIEVDGCPKKTGS